MTDSRKFALKLRDEVRIKAKQLNGIQVTEALFELTDEMSAGGVDAAWEESGAKDFDLFCITWLTMLTTKLAKYA